MSLRTRGRALAPQHVSAIRSKPDAPRTKTALMRPRSVIRENIDRTRGVSQSAVRFGASVSMGSAPAQLYLNEQRRQYERDRAQQLDQDVKRRPRRVLERVAHRVSDDRRLVWIGFLPAVGARL